VLVNIAAIMERGKSIINVYLFRPSSRWYKMLYWMFHNWYGLLSVDRCIEWKTSIRSPIYRIWWIFLLFYHNILSFGWQEGHWWL